MTQEQVQEYEDQLLEDLDAEDFLDATDNERQALKDTQVILAENDQRFIDKLVDQLIVICDELSGFPLRPYQLPLARRIMESMILCDGARLTALFSRQSGKTEAIASVVATMMIMFPRLANVYPQYFERFRNGVLVGAFAPVDRQSNILFDRIKARLASERAKNFMRDPEIDDFPTGQGITIKLRKCGSLARKISCHPRSIIEGDTFHIILIDEAQGADNKTVRKSVLPMGASTRATCVYTGTCTYTKNFFYDDIQKNKRIILARGKRRQNHFQVDYREVGKWVPAYKKFVQDEMISIGENSDEFRLSYKCEWLIERGMFTTAEELDRLGNIKLQKTEKFWQASPVAVGIDCGRIQDRTVVTVIFVDWNNPDDAGYCYHQVLNWLDLEGMDWEEQYHRIVEFLSQYKIYKVAVDGGGVGDVVINRLRTLMPHVEFEPMGDGPADQSDRWKYLKQLMERGMISWPQGAKVRQLRTWRRFYQEMCDLLLDFKGPNMKCEAPDEANAHDDYPDSLAMGCILSRAALTTRSKQVVSYDNFMYQRSRRT